MQAGLVGLIGQLDPAGSAWVPQIENDDGSRTADPPPKGGFAAVRREALFSDQESPFLSLGCCCLSTRVRQVLDASTTGPAERSSAVSSVRLVSAWGRRSLHSSSAKCTLWQVHTVAPITSDCDAMHSSNLPMHRPCRWRRRCGCCSARPTHRQIWTITAHDGPSKLGLCLTQVRLLLCEANPAGTLAEDLAEQDTNAIGHLLAQLFIGRPGLHPPPAVAGERAETRQKLVGV